MILEIVNEIGWGYCILGVIAFIFLSVSIGYWIVLVVSRAWYRGKFDAERDAKVKNYPLKSY